MNQHLRKSSVWKTVLGVSLAFLALAGMQASAVTNTWDGGSLVSSGWGQGANWVGDSLPTFDSTADIAFYQPGALNLPTNFLESARTVRSLTFNDDADSAAVIRLATTLTGTTAANLTFDTDAVGGNAELKVTSGAAGNVLVGVAGGSVVLADNLLINHNGSGMLTINRPMTGAFSVTKNGAGTVTLAGANTFSGGLTTTAGTLVLSAAGASGIGPMTVSGGTVTLIAANVVSTNITVNGGIVTNATGNTVADTARVTVNAGGTFTYNFGGGMSDTIGSLAGAGSVLGKAGGTGNGMTLTVGGDNTTDAVFSGVYAGDKARLAKTGTGRQILTGANTYSLATVTNANVDTNYCTIILQGILQFGNGGSTGSTSSRSCISNNATLAFNRSNTVRQGVDFGGCPIVGSGNVLQQGTGTLVLTNANTYSGGTAVNAGTLLVNNPTGSGTGSGSVTVDGGATLGGSGTIQGAVSCASGASLLPGDSAVVGTLTLQNTLALNGNTLFFDLPSSGANDVIALSGAGTAGVLTLNGTNTVKLNLLNGALPAGVYTLMTFAATNGTGSLSLDVAARNLSLTVSETNVILTAAGSGAGSANLTWVGDGSGNLWAIGTSALWSNGGSADVYYDLDSVTFNDTGSASPALNLAANVQPGSVVVSNNVKPYTFSGAGSIAGAATLTKQGTNTLTLSCANAYSGATTVSAGKLAYGANDAIGAGAVTVNGTNAFLALGTFSDTVGTVTLDGGGQITGTSGALSTTGSFELKKGAVSAILAGTGALNVTTPNSIVTLSGSNTYSGVTTVGVGGVSNTVLVVNNNLALGSTAAGTTVNWGGVAANSENRVVLTNGVTITDETLTLVTSGTSRTGLHCTHATGTNTWDGNIVLSGNGQAYLNCDFTGGTLLIGGSSADTITGTAGSLSIRGNGTVVQNSRVNIGSTSLGRNDLGTWIINTASNTWGATAITFGTLRLGISDALPVTTTLTIGKGDSVGDAIFDLNGFNQTIAGLGEAHFFGAGAQKITSAAAATLTLNNTAVNTYGISNSVIQGAVSLVKTGSGTLVLTGTNTTSGSFTVSNGTLIVSGTGTLGVNSTKITVAAGTLTLSNSVSIADSATVRIANGGGAKVNVAAGVNETVGYLYYGDKQKPAGTYSAAGGVDFTDTDHFAGSGTLTVRHGNGGTLIGLR